jgi:hypothetical protein
METLTISINASLLDVFLAIGGIYIYFRFIGVILNSGKLPNHLICSIQVVVFFSMLIVSISKTGLKDNIINIGLVVIYLLIAIVSQYILYPNKK